MKAKQKRKQETVKNEGIKMNEIGVAIVGVFILVFFFFVFGCFVVVPAGTIGVVDVMGNVKDMPMGTGLSLKLPWENVLLYPVRTVELKETAETPSDEGLTVSLDVSILYHVDSTKAVNIYKTLGTHYTETYIEPNFRSVVRGITSSYDAKSLYTSEREVIADKIFQELEPKMSERGIILEKVLLRGVSLPDRVKDGIESKLVAEQDAQKMEFIIQKETLEADRKQIEAGGIAKAQAIIDNSLTDRYLSWYWISNLDKYDSVIYVPVGDNAMPLFKDVDSAIAQSGAKNTPTIVESITENATAQ